MKKEIKKQLTKKNKNKINYGWICKILFLSFAISVLFSFASETALPNVNIFLAIVIALSFIFIGVSFDMVGVAVTASDEAVFHSMSANKVRGAKIAVKLKKNADKVSSFCQDVISQLAATRTTKQTAQTPRTLRQSPLIPPSTPFRVSSTAFMP